MRSKQSCCSWKGFAAPRSEPSGRAEPQVGFTLAEALVALGLTLVLSALFLALFRAGQGAFRLEPELSAMRLDARVALDHITADLLRAGSGLPVEIPVFSDLGPAGDGDPDGLDFLAAPERMAAAAFEPVMGFDGAEVTLVESASRFSRPAGSARNTWAVVFNDDEMLPRWVFGRVTGVSGGGLLDPAAGGARVRLAASSNAWHVHFNPLVDADTFAPGGGGGLVERGLDSLFGGLLSSLLPGSTPPLVTELTSQVVGAVLERLAAGRKLPAKGVGDPADEGENADDGYGLFGLGQPGLAPVERIRYRVAPPSTDAVDQRSVLMRRVNEAAPQPVGFVEDLQVQYLTGTAGDTAQDDPPGFIGDFRPAADLGRHIVRGIEIAIQVRSPGPVTGGGEPLTRTWRRRVGLRVAAAGVDRREWEEMMQLKALPTDIPRIGPLRYIPLPW